MKKSRIIVIVVGVLLLAGLSYFLWSKKKGTSELPADAEPTAESHEEKASDDLQAERPEKLDSKAPSQAPATSDDPKMKKIETFINQSRVLDEFKAMDELLEAQLGQIQDAAHLSAKEQEDLENLRKIISSEALLAKYKELIYERFDEKELDHLNEIYQNPLVAKMKDSQVYNQTPEGQKELMEYWKSFKLESLPKERLALLKEMDKGSGGTDNTMKMMRKFGEMNGGDKNDPKVKKETEKFLETLRPQIEQSFITQLSKIHANNSEADLQNLNKMIKDPVYQKEIGVKAELSNNAMNKVAETMVSKHDEKDKNEAPK